MGRIKLLGMVLLASCVPIATLAQEAKQKFEAAQKSNAAEMRQYTWKSRTELKLKGESKNVKLEQVRYDSSGQLQKTPIESGQPPQQEQAQSGGRRGGRLKQKVIENKKEEFAEIIKGLAGLVTSYAHLPPEKMQAFIKSASFKPGQGQDAGTIQITGTPGVVPGDSMSIWVNQSTMLFRRVTINTVYENKPATVACAYENTMSGLNYMLRAVLDYPSKDLQVTVDNSEYQK